jgi:ABC-type transporter Mla subunit MlaD
MATATRTRPSAGEAGFVARARPDRADDSRFLDRWLKVWIALLVVVTLVVVVYLIAITNSLASINGNLGVANRAVTGAGGDTKTLPGQVEGINASLAAIDPALKPIPGQADQIIGALTEIDGKLATTDNSLKDTSSSLQGTSSQLVDTASILTRVLGQAGTIRENLNQADQAQGPCEATTCSTNKLGVQNIHQRVAIANNILTPAEADARSILSGLGQVNANLLAICSTGTVGLLAGPC